MFVCVTDTGRCLGHIFKWSKQVYLEHEYAIIFSFSFPTSLKPEHTPWASPCFLGFVLGPLLLIVLDWVPPWTRLLRTQKPLFLEQIHELAGSSFGDLKHKRWTVHVDLCFMFQVSILHQSPPLLKSPGASLGQSRGQRTRYVRHLCWLFAKLKEKKKSPFSGPHDAHIHMLSTWTGIWKHSQQTVSWRRPGLGRSLREAGGEWLWEVLLALEI